MEVGLSCIKCCGSGATHGFVFEPKVLARRWSRVSSTLLEPRQDIKSSFDGRQGWAWTSLLGQMKDTEPKETAML